MAPSDAADTIQMAPFGPLPCLRNGGTLGHPRVAPQYPSTLMALQTWMMRAVTHAGEEGNLYGVKCNLSDRWQLARAIWDSVDAAAAATRIRLTIANLQAVNTGHNLGEPEAGDNITEDGAIDQHTIWWLEGMAVIAGTNRVVASLAHNMQSEHGTGRYA